MGRTIHLVVSVVLVAGLLLFVALAFGVIEGPDGHSSFGEGVCGVGDVDGDGIPDWLVADPGFAVLGDSFREKGQRGRVWMISGSDRSTIWSVASEQLDDGFGCGLSRFGDVSGDGVPDCLVGSKDLHADRRGSVRVLSGQSGDVIRVFEGRRGGDAFGITVEGLGDVDGDGVPDLAVGSLGPEGSESFTGRVEVLSGDSGELLHSIDCWIGGYYGESRPVLRLGDVNGDARADFVVTRLLDESDGSFEVRSGLDFRVIWSRAAGERNQRPVSTYDWNADGVLDLVCVGKHKVHVRSGTDGARLAFLDLGKHGGGARIFGDVDGDAVPDLLVPDPDSWVSFGCVRLLSGRDGREFYVTPPSGGWHFGLFFDLVGDIDSDGVTDFVVGGEHIVSRSPGVYWVHSGATGQRIGRYGRMWNFIVSLD